MRCEAWVTAAAEAATSSPDGEDEGARAPLLPAADTRSACGASKVPSTSTRATAPISASDDEDAGGGEDEEGWRLSWRMTPELTRRRMRSGCAVMR